MDRSRNARILQADQDRNARAVAESHEENGYDSESEDDEGDELLDEECGFEDLDILEAGDDTA